MKVVILLISCFLIQPFFDEQRFTGVCEICGEYNGGRFGFSWVTLTLNSNGGYHYYEGLHTMQSIKDKGDWKLEANKLVLNSSKKTKWKGQNKSKGIKSYLFKNQICSIKEDLILIEKEENSNFNATYYTLKKGVEKE